MSTPARCDEGMAARGKEGGSSRHPFATIAATILGSSLAFVDGSVVNVALPTLSSELDASTSELQWIVDSYSLVFACLLLAFGSLGDRLGRKGIMQLGLLLFAITSVVAAFSTTSEALIGARAAMGFSAAFVFPATLAILTETEVLLVFIGGVFVIEAVTWMIQIASFKRTGRRVFLIVPIHHHFEMKAWSETKIMVRFWIVGAILCAIGFVLYYRYYLRFQL